MTDDWKTDKGALVTPQMSPSRGIMKPKNLDPRRRGSDGFEDRLRSRCCVVWGCTTNRPSVIS
jgi:hypothetical protein